MTFTLVLIAFSSLITLSAAQTYPPCALNCIATSDLSGCASSADFQCLCGKQGFLQTSQTCIRNSCTGSDLTEALDTSQELCAAIGVTLSFPSLGSPATTTTSSLPSKSSTVGSSSPSNTNASSTSQPQKNSTIGLIIGGAVGGVVVLGLLALALILCLRKKRRRTVLDLTEAPRQERLEPNILSSEITLLRPGLPYGYPSMAEMTPASSSQPGLPHVSMPVPEVMSCNDSYSSIPYTYAPVSAAATHMNSASSTRSHLLSDSAPSATTVSKSSESPLFVSNPPDIVVTSESQSSSKLVELTPPPQPTSSNGLTEDQARFVNELRSMKVPTAEIATIIENMRREGGGIGSHENQDQSIMEYEGPPPSYDFKGPSEVVETTASMSTGSSQRI